MKKTILCLLLLPMSAFSQALSDSTQLLQDLRWLSSDILGGRRPDSPGGRAAAQYISAFFASHNLKFFKDEYFHPFTVSRGNASLSGKNVIGYIEGAEQPQIWMVISAHYDHVGTMNNQVYNGADDNASGTAGLLQIAAYFSKNKPKHSILFAAWDAEEMGLQGARAFMQEPAVPVDQIALNLNMDMISRNEQKEMYITGTHPYPFLKSIAEEGTRQSKIQIRYGHDRPEDHGAQNWVSASDHGVFHQAGVPFLYFGVEDHPDYHRPTDDFERIMPSFYFQAVQTILQVAISMDQHLDTVMIHRKEAVAK
ncbi:MAG: M28 family peptidase [Bacteroidetes Order II. Incertae sedis bacterium]|nr:M28 family peptidase [Bacteroidetes Order II. bacterium]